MRGRLIRKKLQSPITKPPLFPLSPHCLFSHPQKCSGGIIDKQPTSSKNNFILCMWRCQWSYIHFKYNNKISKIIRAYLPMHYTTHQLDKPFLSLIQGTLSVCTWTILTSKCPHMILFGPKLLPFLSLSASPNRGNVCKTNWNQISAQCQLCPKL